MLDVSDSTRSSWNSWTVKHALKTMNLEILNKKQETGLHGRRKMEHHLCRFDTHALPRQ
jgi:hypothetical protein